MKLWSKARSLFRRNELDAEMSEEIRLHLELQAERHIAAGMDPDEARYEALRQFGGVEQVKERCREQRGWMWVDHLGRDFRFAGRMLRKHPAFVAAATLSLALCIGANTAVFSMLHALVLKPLPFPEPGTLVEVYNSFPKVGFDKLASNCGQYLDFKEHADALGQASLWRLDDCTWGDEQGAARVTAATATAEIFEALGVQPLIGRFFTAENHIPTADRVIVLSQSFWVTRFGSDPEVIGRRVQFEGETFEIIGVAPRALEAFDARAKLFRPLSWPQDQPPPRVGYSPRLFGRVKPMRTLDEVAAQVSAREKVFYETARPDIRQFFDQTGHVVKVATVQSQRAASVAKPLWLLQGGVFFVLLIGGVNVANLMLARTNARRAELATRLALGAGRGAIARQMLVESLLLAFLGAAGGVALAWSSVGAMNRFALQLIPDASPFTIDGPVLGLVLFITVGVGLVTAAVPILHVLRGDLSDPRQIRGRGASAGRRARVVSGALAGLQIAFALILLTGAGLLIRSFAKAVAVDRGFDSTGVVAARIALPKGRAADFPRRLEAALHELPDVNVALSTTMPFQTGMPLGTVTLRDQPEATGTAQPSAFYCGASTDYLPVLRIPLREGRWFDRHDGQRRNVVVVDEDFADRYFTGRSAVGQRFVLNSAAPTREEDWLEIVGVAGRVRHQGVEESSGQPCLYRPLMQTPFYGELSVLIRSGRPPSEVSALLRQVVAATDASLPVFQVGPMDEIVSDSFSARRGLMGLLAAFAGVALLLAAVGVYGVLAYDVSQRTREIGIRGAIGATRWQIAGGVLRQGLAKTAIGIGTGLVGAALLGRAMASLLYEVRPTDLLVYGASTALLSAVALLASWLPARRAARVDPVIALRCE